TKMTQEYVILATCDYRTANTTNAAPASLCAFTRSRPSPAGRSPAGPAGDLLDLANEVVKQGERLVEASVALERARRPTAPCASPSPNDPVQRVLEPVERRLLELQGYDVEEMAADTGSTGHSAMTRASS